VPVEPNASAVSILHKKRVSPTTVEEIKKARNFGCTSYQAFTAFTTTECRYWMMRTVNVKTWQFYNS